MSKFAYRLVLLLIVVATGTIIDLPGALGSVIRVVAIPALLVTGLVILLRGSFRRLDSYYWFVILFFTWRIISYTWSVSPDDTITGLSRIFPLLVISMVIWETCRTREQADGALQAFVLGGYLLVLSLAYSFAIGAAGPDADRVAAGGFNPDDFLYLIPVPIAWYLARRNIGRNKFRFWLNLLYVIAAPLGIILTAGRASFVIAIPIYAYILWSARKVKTSIKIGFAVALIALVIVLVNLGVESKFDRLATTITNPSAGSKWGGALNGRNFLWAIAIKEFTLHPVLGTGAGTFPYFSANSESVATARSPEGAGLPVHNTYLSILSETGVIGFLFFAALSAIAVRAAIKQSDPERRGAFVVSLIAMAIGISTLTYESNIGIWLLFTLIVDSYAADRSLANFTNAPDIPQPTALLPERFESTRMRGS